LGSHT
jgi:hypothetical protein